jgi:hypothetical protein
VASPLVVTDAYYYINRGHTSHTSNTSNTSNTKLDKTRLRTRKSSLLK